LHEGETLKSEYAKYQFGGLCVVVELVLTPKH
jgi:hypothetical protein